MKQFSVLIIDDSEEDRYLLKRQLQEINLTDTIHEADDGKTALDFLCAYDENLQRFPDRFPPLLIFLDINMPVVNGFDFLEAFSKLRKQQELRSTILMMFTSSDQEDDRKKSFSYEFVKGFIVKMPPTAKELLENIQAACPHLF